MTDTTAPKNQAAYSPFELVADYIKLEETRTFNGVLRDPRTGRFVSRKAADERGWMFVVLAAVNLDAVTIWAIDSDGFGHSHLACRAIAGEIVRHGDLDDAWSCGHCTAVESIPWEMLHRENHTGGLGGDVAKAIIDTARNLGYPIKVKDLANEVGCSVGRVYEVVKAGGLKKLGGLIVP